MSSSPPNPHEPKSYAGAWVATVLLIAAFVLGLIFFPPLFEEPKGKASDMVLFVGRFHPIVLHLPVGALAVLTMIELLCLTRKGEASMGPAALLVLWIGSAGAVVAVLAGIMLSREGGYEGGNFTLHQTMALVGTIGVLLSLIVRITAMGQGNKDLLHAYRAVFFLSFGVMGLGAHFGGNISHGNKFLTEFAPEPIKSQMVGFEKFMLSFVEKPKSQVPDVPPPVVPGTGSAGSATTTTPSTNTPPTVPPPTTPSGAGGDKLVFQHVILPILEAKCNKCHNEAKAKGKLRMDSFAGVMAGGENGNNVVAGKPADSLSVQRIELPDSDDEHMPPEGKEQLTPAEIAAIRYWIQSGASDTQKLGDAQFPPEAAAAVEAATKG